MVMLKFHSIYQRFLLWVKKIALHKSDIHIFSKNMTLNVVIGYKETTWLNLISKNKAGLKASCPTLTCQRNDPS